MPTNSPPDPITEVMSPTFSECDSVSGLLENGNCDTNCSRTTTRTSKIEALNQVKGNYHYLVAELSFQVVQRFRFTRSTNYSTLGSCPNLARMNSRTLLLRTIPRNGENHNENLLNTQHGMIKVYKAGNPQGPTLVTVHDLGLDGFSKFPVIL